MILSKAVAISPWTVYDERRQDQDGRYENENPRPKLLPKIVQM